MLRRFVSRSTGALAFALAVALLAGGCFSHSVITRPNTELRRTVGQTLFVENLTGAPLTLLPALNRAETNWIALPPGSTTNLSFTLSEQTNRAAAGERELVLVTEQTSAYVAQSALDLVLRARFGLSTTTRELRITPGFCLLETNLTGTRHALPLRTPPLAGVPLKRLCPDP